MLSKVSQKKKSWTNYSVRFCEPTQLIHGQIRLYRTMRSQIGHR